jgi:4-amino-4-deoxy-L-arabinose transferase-like glycosyltransferase
MSALMKRLVPLAAIFVVALALRSLVASIPLERDEGAYAYVAQRWLHGETPYQTAFDHKPPGVLAAYAAILFGFGGNASPAAIHWATQIYSLATLAFVAAAGRRVAGERAGLLAAALAALALVDASVLGSSSNSEVFQILPQTAALWTLLRYAERPSVRRAFAAGIALGAAALFKQIAVVLAVPALAFLLWRGWRRGVAAAAFGAGLAAPVAVVVAYFAARGALGALYECTFVYNRVYASAVAPSSDTSASWASLSGVAGALWPMLGLAVASPFLRRRGSAADDGTAGGYALVAAWAVFSLLSIAVGGRFFPHYFVVLVPPLAMLAGVSAAGLAARASRAPSAALAWAPVAVAALAAWAVHPWYYAPDASGEEKVWRLYGLNPFAESARVADFIAERTTPEDRVLVVGSEPQILYYAGRRSASRFPYLYPLGLPGPEAEARQTQVVSELTRERPRILVTEFAPPWWEVVRPQALLDGVRRALERDYAVVAVLPGNRRGPATLRVGAEASALWSRYPYWYEGATPWSLAVWQRRDP